MPPKVKIAAEEIVEAALQLVRKEGAEALCARTLAAALGCSTQPIFSNFDSMESLGIAVYRRAEQECADFLKRETKRGEFPPYKANGMAYILFAKEERELFKLLYMCDRTRTPIPESSELTDEMESILRGNTGLSADDAKLFHLEMWAFVHGIAAMFATGFLDLDRALVSRMLTDSYQGLCKQFQKE